MITCRECTELLLDYLSGELEDQLRENIRSHLERCPPCVTFVETYQVTIRMTRQLPCAELPTEVAERLRAALEEFLNKD
jgi:anti-sigma factor RsiW